MKLFIVTQKILLTPDVFELHFECNETFDILPGQFVTFILPGIGGRAYSILEQVGHKTVLIIKRVKEEYGGRGGSRLICDTDVGETLKGVGPAGHFILKDADIPRLFIGTGTGLVPLYNQILAGLERGDTKQYTLLFGVRTQEDLFYLEQYKTIAENYSNFTYEIYLSREETEVYNKGYVIDFLTEKNVSAYSEFYICGAPVMVDSAVERLVHESISSENIFTEKY